MKIRMTADSTCDLTPEWIRKYQIGIAPLSVIIDGEVFHDGVDVTPRDIFRAAEAGKSVRTAAVNTYEYKEFFRKQLEKCDQLVHVCLSSEFSTSYNDAVEASREVGNVFVVDSRNLSTGSGLLVLEGIRMINDGAEDGAAIAEALRAKADLVDSSFVVRTIDYLRRGGRCSGLEALGAKMLHIRPSIVVADGKMHPGQKYRGRYEHYLKHYIRDLLENDDNIDFSRVVVVHSPSEEGLVRFAIDTVKSYGLFKEVLEAMAGCTICTHCGPDTLGLMFMRKKKKEA
ncbi:DegV family protein [Aristaeella lactis]|uniref:EDD domain protein, DegV family n=1 Tax=Aristaeella lactis TaxID=3046383 RepID=A0AC61PPD5_9FIRM|nr:DegV family protein [Aristaeella lactis]QUA54440.1 DegV family protein [Aristaeella lactis]SMC82976.1 EDD domain protein, DegV family [Aristaeella lactis]